MIRKVMVALATAGAMMATAGPAAAQKIGTGQYSSLYVFGDSLSDDGNLAAALGVVYPAQYGNGLPSPPFYQNSYTNGPVGVEVLAQRLGLAANASLFTVGQNAGTNYAVAGATAAAANGVAGGNLPNQVGAFLLASGGKADASALYTVFIGGNDVRTAAHQGNPTLVDNGLAAEYAGINSLYLAGARNFLIVNVPDVGRIPEFQLGYPGQVATASADTMAYNTGLATKVKTLTATDPGGIFALFDLYTYNANLLGNAASLGITNTTLPCYTATDVTKTVSSATTAACGAIDPTTNQAANINSFYYWDAIHPTAKVQAALGNALADFALGVPEPATWLSMILGFGLIGAVLRRRRVGGAAIA